jgi:Rps23 Pro-64 3,4-dihydroxylase Tpa1-like proline 4-hydroxylase
MQHFISDEHFLEGLQNELSDMICHDKNNDLYKFQQTDDLRKVTSPHIATIRKLFYDKFRAWMSDVTGIAFTSRVDLSSSKYEYTDVLLCHDDELDTRRIAFVLYLSPSWNKEDGGLLDLFDTDEHGQPRDVVESLLPTWNSLSWFEVTEASHHQVSEVLSKGKTRLSVHGWLHSSPVVRSARYAEPLPELLPHIHIEEEMVYDWLNPIYLDAGVQAQIREKFEVDSEIELQEFLKEDKYAQLVDALRDTQLKWHKYGPPNKRNYHILPADNTMPDVVGKCIEFLRSEAVFLILSNLTGLRLHRLAPKPSDVSSDQLSSTDEADVEGADDVLASGADVEGAASADVVAGALAENMSCVDATTGTVDDSSSQSSESSLVVKRQRLDSDGGAAEKRTKSVEGKKLDDDEDTGAECNPRCRYEVRRWQHGSYTLVHDTDLGGSEFALDALLYCSCKDWQKDFGGHTSYIARGEDEELLTVFPMENSLALVYRDKDTMKFVKHVNHRATESPHATEFYDFSFTYYE